MLLSIVFPQNQMKSAPTVYRQRIEMQVDDRKLRRLEQEILGAIRSFGFSEMQIRDMRTSIQQFFSELRNETYRRLVQAVVLFVEVNSRGLLMRLHDQAI